MRRKAGRQVFLKELVDHEMLLQEARRQGLDLDDAIRDRVRRYKEKLLIDELLKDRMKTTVELTKEELDRYYEQHASELLTPLKVRVAQMLLPNYPAAKDLETQVNRGWRFRQVCPALLDRLQDESQRRGPWAVSQRAGHPRSG